MLYQRARFATQLPVGYRYSPSHFWMAEQEPQVWRVGLTKFGSRMLGEMVDYGFEVEPGAPVVVGQVIGWVEGFKALTEIASIADGRFAGVNPALDQNPALVNQDPFGAGWLYAVHGQPGANCTDVEGYKKILDQAIDRMLKSE